MKEILFGSDQNYVETSRSREYQRVENPKVEIDIMTLNSTGNVTKHDFLIAIPLELATVEAN